MNKTLCVDAQGLLKQSFHANQTTYSKQFGYIGCILTFYVIIRKLIREENINKVILFWDGENSGRLRYNIYPQYKSNRDKNWNNSDIILNNKDITREENSDKSLLVQRERIKKYAEELFFRQVEDKVCEADDCIAYYVKNNLEPDELAVIYTNDRDFCQLVSDQVHVYIANLKSIVKPENYRLFFEHHQSNSALIKAIEGCKTDVIHGVSGLGEKTLLKHFPELRNMPVTFDHLFQRAIDINKSRKIPLQALNNLIEGITIYPNSQILNGKHLFELNYKLVNLSEPFMTEDAIEEIEINTTHPISDSDRGGKNLMRLMYEDGLINAIPGGADGYKNFLVEFLPVVKKEKEKYLKYLNS